MWLKSKSESDAEEEEIKYARRTGCTDSGQEYEIYMATLLALRCAQLPSAKEFWIASNVDHVGDFDDVVLCMKTPDNRSIAYLVQLKHQENPEKISNHSFTYVARKTEKKKRHKYREDFSLAKYLLSYEYLMREIESADHSSDIIKYLKECEKISFVIYTNKLANENTILNLHVDNELDFLNTSNQNAIFKFNTNKIPMERHFLDNLFLFCNQLHLEEAPKMIEKEIKKIFSSSKLANLDFATIGSNLVDFVRDNTCKTSTLNKTNLLDKLVGLALQPYELDFLEEPFFSFIKTQRSNVWSSITFNHAITLIDSDDFVAKFLKSSIRDEVQRYAKSSEGKFWNDVALVETFGLDTKLMNLTDETTLFEFYHCLWFNRKVPLLLTLQNSKDYQTVSKILEHSPSNLSVVLLKPESSYVQSAKRNFTFFNDLNSEHKTTTLNHRVKFQGRSIILKEILDKDEALQSCVTARDVVYILANLFDVGYHNCLPSNFIKQQLAPTCEDLSDVKLFKPSLEKAWNSFSASFPAINIIVGKPGMGKTVFLHYLASVAPPDVWIVTINLTDYEDYFYDFPDFNAAQHLSYFHKKLLEASDCVNKLSSDSLFQTTLKNNKILILIDGFDEICPHFQNEVTALAKIFLNGLFEVWITTRPIMTSYLEGALRSFNPIFWSLQPFSVKDQEQYLKSLICSKQLDSKDRAEEFSVIFLNTIETIFYDRTLSFTAIPLHLEILGNDLAARYRKASLFGQISLHGLLEEILKRKFEILCRKFGSDSKRMQVFVKTYQELCALKLTFPHRLVKNLKIDNSLEKCLAGKDITLFQRDGVLVPSTTSCRFTHRLFANFFAAQWLTGNMKSSDKTTRQVAKNLLTYRFQDFDSSTFQIFDGILAKNCCSSPRTPEGNLFTPKNILQDLTYLDHKDTTTCIDLDYALQTCNFALANELSKRNSCNVHIKVSSKLRSCMFALCCHFGYEDLFRALLMTLGTRAILVEDYELNHSIAAFCNVPGEIQNSIFFTYLKNLQVRTLSELFTLFKLDNPFFFLRLVVSQGNGKLLERFLKDLDDINQDDQDSNTLLYYAAKFNRLEVLKILLINGSDPNKPCQDGNSALHIASRNGFFDVVSELILNNADVDQENDSKQTPLFLAVEHRRLEIVNYLVQNDANPELKDEGSNSLLHYAVKSNFLQFAAKFVLKYPESLPGRNINGDTALALALRQRHTDCIELLLMDSNGKFVLHEMARYGSCEILRKLLVANNDSVNEKNPQGETALHLALKEGHVESCKLLLEFGADCNLADQDRYVPFHGAIQKGLDGLIEPMILTGASVSSKGPFSATPLLLAILHDNTVLARRLIGLGADCSVTDEFGNTCLHYAAQLENLQVMNLLSSACDVDVQNCFGRTALHYAVISEKTEAAKFLLENGAQENKRDVYGKTALNYAHDLAKEAIVCLFKVNEATDVTVDVNGGTEEDITFLLLGDKIKTRTSLDIEPKFDLDEEGDSCRSPKQNLLITIIMECLRVQNTS